MSADSVQVVDTGLRLGAFAANQLCRAVHQVEDEVITVLVQSYCF